METEILNPAVHVAIGERLHSNSTIFINGSDVFLVEAMAAREDAEKLREYIETELNKRVSLVPLYGYETVVTVSVANFADSKRLGLFFLFALPSWLTTVFGIMALDLFTYFAHVLMHKTSLGWRFHRVHHSDKEVNVTTAFRQHPGETVWRILWYVLAIATFGIPPWVVVLYLVGSTLNAQLEHTNIRLFAPLDRVLRLLLVTPNMHKVHHCRACSDGCFC